MGVKVLKSLLSAYKGLKLNKHDIERMGYIAGLLSAYKGLKHKFSRRFHDSPSSLLSAYKGLKLLTSYWTESIMSSSLLSAYKGLKQARWLEAVDGGKWFIKCL